MRVVDHRVAGIGLELTVHDHAVTDPDRGAGGETEVVVDLHHRPTAEVDAEALVRTVAAGGGVGKDVDDRAPDGHLG